MKKIEFASGKKAREVFEITMSNIFRVFKPPKQEKQPKKAASEGKKN